MVTLKKNSPIFGNALPVTLYVLIFTLYTVVFSFQFNVSLIRISYTIFYAVSLWYFFKSFNYWKDSRFIRVLTLMFSLAIVYCLFLIIIGTSGFKREIDAVSYSLLYVASVLPVYVFYYFGRKGLLNTSWFQVITILFCFNAYAIYYKNQQLITEILFLEGDDYTNNSGYIIVSLLPLLAFFNKRSVIQYVGLFLIEVATIMCFKRGAILVGFITIAYFLYNKINTRKNASKILFLVLGIVVLFLLYRYFDNLLLINDYFNSRVMRTYEGDSSGRNDIYGFFWQYFISSENGLLGFLFGNGAASTVKLMGIEAHNDWLEFAINMGLLGVVVYFVYWLTLLRYYKFAKKNLSEIIVMAMGMVLVINFGRTLFSMSFNDMSFFSASIIGYTMAMVDEAKKGDLITSN